MSDDNVLNRNLSPVTREQLRLGNPADVLDSDYRTVTDQPQITFNGHIVPPPPPPDTQPPLIIGVYPIPQSFPFGIVNSGVFVDVTSDEPLVDYDILSNWVISGAAAAGDLSVSNVSPLGSNGISFSYRVTLAGTLQEGLLEFTLNPSDASNPVRDSSGNPVAKFTWDYWIDLTRPRITSIQPDTSQTLIYGVNFFGAVKVFFSEFIGVEGQDSSPALNSNRYMFHIKNSNGATLTSVRPVSTELTKNDVYAYGADDGATTVQLTLPTLSTGVVSQMSEIVLQVNDPDKLQDRAGNDLLPDVMEFSWAVQPADTVGPTWTPIDPTGACEVIPPPIEIDGTTLTDGMVRMRFRFSEPVVGVTDPANWIISGAPLDSDSTTQAMRVDEVVEVLGGDQPEYEVRLSILGHSGASGVSVSLNSSAITDASGNSFTSAPLSLTFEDTFPTVSTVNPVTVNPSWDYKVVINFDSPVAMMSQSQAIQSWKLVRADSPDGTFYNPVDITQHTNSQGVTSHNLLFSQDAVNKLSGGDTNFALAVVQVTNLGNGYDADAGKTYPNMVRGFPSSTSFNNDGGSCGGQGVPLSASSKEFQQFAATITYRGDATGPNLVSVNPPSGSQVTGTELYNGVTFKFDEEVDWSRVQYDITGSTGMIENINASGDSVSFSVVGSDQPGVVYRVDLSDIRDLSGNVGSDVSATYTMRDTQGPRIAKIEPNNVTLCPGQDQGNTVQISFHEDLDPATVITSNFSLSVNGLSSPDANQAINIKSVQLVDGNLVNMVIAPEADVHTTVGHNIRITASQNVTDVDGNPVDSGGDHAVFTHSCNAINPPENLEVVVDYSGSSPAATLYWAAPSTGLPASSYKAELLSPFEGPWTTATSYTGPTTAGTQTARVKARFVNSATSMESDWATVSYTVANSYTKPTLSNVGFVDVTGKNLDASSGTLLLGPRYGGGGVDTSGQFGVSMQATSTGNVHVYLISGALRGTDFPPGLTPSDLDLDASVPRIDTFPADAGSKAEWIKLGSTGPVDSNSVIFVVTGQSEINNPTQQAGYDLGGAAGTDWYYPPLIFNDLFLIALVAEHPDGAAAGSSRYSDPVVLGANNSGRPALWMPDPVADNATWGSSTFNSNPVPTITQVGNALEVKWGAPIRGVSNPSSYRIGLFKGDSSLQQWEHVTTSNVSGASRTKTFSSGLIDGVNYMARVVTVNEMGASWTLVDWDDDGDNFLDTAEPAFLDGWGGRTNVEEYTYQGGGNDQKEVQFDYSVPAHQASVNVSSTTGQKIILYFTGDVLSATAETYRVTLSQSRCYGGDLPCHLD